MSRIIDLALEALVQQPWEMRGEGASLVADSELLKHAEGVQLTFWARCATRIVSVVGEASNELFDNSELLLKTMAESAKSSTCMLVACCKLVGTLCSRVDSLDFNSLQEQWVTPLKKKLVALIDCTENEPGRTLDQLMQHKVALKGIEEALIGTDTWQTKIMQAKERSAEAWAYIENERDLLFALVPYVPCVGKVSAPPHARLCRLRKANGGVDHK